MDVTLFLVFITLFIVASTSLVFIFKVGMGKLSYEEALAEQRKQTSALLGSKPKPKESKKTKKAAKKLNKEKSNAPENETPDESGESVDSKDSPPESTEKTQQSQVVNKGTSKVKENKATKTHVEFKKEPEVVPIEAPVEKEIKEVINKKRVKKVRPILQKRTSEAEIILPIVEVPLANHFEEMHPKDEFELLRLTSKDDLSKQESPKTERKPEKSSKKNKQQKNEGQHQQQQQQQQIDKNNSVTEIVLAKKEKPIEEKAVENNIVAPLVHEPVVNSGKEKKKKKSEINSRQQITAERDQLIHSVRNAELSRDEVQLLIDLLLNKQLEAPTVIDDWSEGKSDPIQKLKKQLADKEKQLADEQDALQGVQAKLREVRSEQLAERAQNQQKLKLIDEARIETMNANKGLQQKLQELEDLKNKQMASVGNIIEENKALKTQIMQMEATIINFQETEARLIADIQGLNENRAGFSYQIQRTQEELAAANEIIKEMERNHSYALAAQQEEIRKLAEQLNINNDTYLKEEQKLTDIIAQLKLEKQKLQEENSVQMNGSAEESKEHQVEVLNLSNELSSVKNQLSSASQSLLDMERQYRSDLSSSQDKYEQLKSELEEQKNKNNELRQKNWKVMEALNAAESRNKPVANKSAVVDVDQIATEIKTKEQNAHKQFIQRLFPEIESLKSASGDDWQTEVERVIKQHVSQLRAKSAVEPPSPQKSTAEVTKLQSEVQHYKKIIDETEGILKKLESHIEQEELKWRHELNQKDAEIQELKNQRLSQLEIKVSTLENQLAQERAENQRLREEKQLADNRPEVKSVHADSTAAIEKLSEEIDRLREQLRIEQSRNNSENNAAAAPVVATTVYQNGDTS